MNTLDPLKDPRFEPLVSRLRSQEAPMPSADFTARTMARRHGLAARRWNLPARALRAAATLAILCGAGVWFIRVPSPAPRAKMSSPVDILMAAQQPDGRWSTDAQHLRPRYDTGVTALALLALMQSDPAPLLGPPADAIRAGIAHLLRQQNPDGRFGMDFSGSEFTHYLAAMALRTATSLSGADPVWLAAAQRAEVHLPAGIQVAKLNQRLAQPDTFPKRWVDAGGPAAHTAIQMLKR